MTANISSAQLDLMLKLQDEINSKINSDWRSANNPWYRAIWTECGELLEHVGWKWWKAQQPDIEQVQLEIVDIWHFGLSDMLNRYSDIAALKQFVQPAIAELLDNSSTTSFHSTDVLSAVEEFAGKAILNKSFDPLSFAKLAKLTGLSFDKLFKQYVGKNILNRFRQDNGYKSGSYIKVWNGKEDNIWLAEIVLRLDPSHPNYADTLYVSLTEAYKQFATGQSA
jgi:dimeric dUTPase (all-alpha-NTP-PPase superfamily)